MHWYVYHSQKAMGHSYASIGASVVYSTKKQPKLCLGDVVWVVEGDSSTPTEFALVDCFKVHMADTPPFPPGYGKFQLKAMGERSLLSKPFRLGAEMEWFEELHSRYITKQRFFHSLGGEPNILDGLLTASGAAI